MKTIIIDKISFTKNLKYINDIYMVIKNLEYEYPNFKNWFYKKTIEDITNGTKTILFSVLNDEIAGLSIMKNTIEEKKICTFRIVKKYQDIRIGSLMIEKSMQILETNNPLITVSEHRINDFNPILNKYGFQLHEIYQSYYKKNVKEYSFNGRLELIPPSSLTFPQKTF